MLMWYFETLYPGKENSTAGEVESLWGVFSTDVPYSVEQYIISMYFTAITITSVGYVFSNSLIIYLSKLFFK